MMTIPYFVMFKFVLLPLVIMEICLGPQSLSWAEPASEVSRQIFSLEELIAEGLRNNPSLKGARERVKAAQAKIPQEKWSLPDPMIGADIEGSKRFADFDDYMNVEYMAQQEIPNPLKLWMRGRVAGREADMIQAVYLAKERALIAQIKSAYYEVFMIERSIDVNRENKGLLEQILKSAEGRYTVGKAGQQDILRAQVELAKLTNELVTLEQRRQTAVARINTLLNRPTRSPIGTTVYKLESRSKNLDWEHLEKLAMEKNPDLLEVNYSVKRQEAVLKLAKFEYLPDFTLRAEARRFTDDEVENEYDAFLGITIPLWGFKKQRNQIKEASALLEEARANYQDMRNSVFFEVQNALVLVESNQRLVALYETSVLPQARQSLQSAMAGYEGDKNDFLTLIDNQRNVKAFQLEYYDSIVKLEQNFADLERAVGTDLEESHDDKI